MNLTQIERDRQTKFQKLASEGASSSRVDPIDLIAAYCMASVALRLRLQTGTLDEYLLQLDAIQLLFYMIDSRCHSKWIPQQLSIWHSKRWNTEWTCSTSMFILHPLNGINMNKTYHQRVLFVQNGVLLL